MSKFAVNLSLQLEVFPTADQAVAAGFDYNQWSPQPKGLKIDKVVVVRNGTQQGRPTADLIMVDEDGNKYVTMITGALLKMLPLD